MDLNQRKLNRDEWNGIEVPVNEREKMILNLIFAHFNSIRHGMLTTKVFIVQK